MNHKKTLTRYCRSVASWLPCPGKQKKQILREIQGNVALYLEENPEADLAAVQTRFGNPQAIAAAYVDGMDTEALLRSLRTRRRIVAIVAATALICVALWAGVVGWAAIREYLSSTGYGVMSPPYT